MRSPCWNIQEILWIIFPIALGYLIACVIMNIGVMKKGQKEKQMSNFSFIILVIGIGIVVLFITQVFAGMFGHIPPH
jgi:Na+/H+ antiporter NhaC